MTITDRYAAFYTKMPGTDHVTLRSTSLPNSAMAVGTVND